MKRNPAWTLILVVDVAYIAWGAGAAIAPEGLRIAAMRMDWLSRAIAPFELTEYVGLAMVWAALAITAPFWAAARPLRATS
jgi:hypothetical protein